MSESLDTLLGELLDGRLSAGRRLELRRRIAADASAKRAYLEAMKVHAALLLEFPAELGKRATPRRLPDWRLIAAAALIVLIFGATMAVLVREGWERQSRQGGVKPQFATLVEVHDAAFGPSDVATTAGSPLSGGFLRLRSGRVQIEFLSGAQVTLIGPAEFGINSAMRGFLKRGKLAAYCPPSAHGFTMGGPGCAVVDLGTRFDFAVSEQGVSKVHVIEGRVKIQPGGAMARVLSTGEAARLEGDGVIVVEEPPVLPRNFVKNGGFEAGEFAYGSRYPYHWQIATGIGNTLDSWIVRGADHWSVDSGFWSPSEGHRCVLLERNPGVDEALEQLIEVEAGKRYVLSFDVAGRFDELTGGEQGLVVQVDGAAGKLVDTEVPIHRPPGFDPHTNPGWVRRSVSFVADSPRVVIRFQNSRRTPGCNVLLDNVSLVEAPAPGHAGGSGEVLSHTVGGEF